MDITAAKNTLAKYKIMEDKLHVDIVLAHDTEWLEQSKNSTLMTLVDDCLLSSLCRIHRQEPI